MIENSIDVLKLQKPGLFQFSRKKSYDEQMRKYSDELLQILDKERTTKSMLDDFTQELKAIESQISYGNKLVEDKNHRLYKQLKVTIMKSKTRSENQRFEGCICKYRCKCIGFFIVI